MGGDLEISEVMLSSGLTPVEANPPATDLVSKKNTKAFIWKYFGFIPDENGQPTGNPRCCLCELEVLAKDSNISNLYSHLRHKHPDTHSIVQAATGTKADNDSRQPSLETTWDTADSYLLTSCFSGESTKSMDLICWA